MRKYAILKDNQEYKRLILDAQKGGDIYIYFSYSLEDHGTSHDLWFETLEDAYLVAEEYGVFISDWIDILEPCNECFRNYIRNVRRNKETLKLEVQVNDEWIDLEREHNYDH